MKTAKRRQAAVISWDGEVYCYHCSKMNVVISVFTKPGRVRCIHCTKIFSAISEKP